MLKKFKVQNFKTFDREIEFDFTPGGYTYNDKAIQNNVINNAVVYGSNGSGKSNLSYAIMDITTHLTDFTKQDYHYVPYLNLNSDSSYAYFYYEFLFDTHEVTYEYKKTSLSEIFDERIYIDKSEIIYEDFEQNIRRLDLKGAETLNIQEREKSLSLVKYIFTNTKLDMSDDNNTIFNRFKKFVEGMLFFSSGTSEKNFYQGLKSSADKVSSYIVDTNNLEKLEIFLNDIGINYKLISGEDSEGNSIIKVKFDKRNVNIFKVASHGTKVLIIYFYWLIQLKQVQFLMIDEFDAFFHNEVSIKLLEKIRDHQVQSVFTTHNTTIMSNDLLRPDCYYIIQNNQIKSLPSLTNKELRFAHNLEKMYNAGKFHDE